MTFEVKKSAQTDKIVETQIVKITGLTSLRVELASFEAVFKLANSQFCKFVINPLVNTPTNLIQESATGPIPSGMMPHLNEIQRNIVIKTVRLCKNIDEPNLIMIEGPPGTGKSHVVTGIVSELIDNREFPETKKLKILICAQSNAAIDTIFDRLVARKKSLNDYSTQKSYKLVRFGVEDKMSPTAKLYSSQNLSKKSTESASSVNVHLSEYAKVARRNAIAEKVMLDEQIKHLEINGKRNSVDMDKLRKLKEKRINVVRFIEDKPIDKVQKEVAIIQGAAVVCLTLSSCIKLQG